VPRATSEIFEILSAGYTTVGTTTDSQQIEVLMELKHYGRRICSAGLPTLDESKDLGSRPRLDPRRGGAQATANYPIIFLNI